jgi:hypothetical protein
MHFGESDIVAAIVSTHTSARRAKETTLPIPSAL